MEGPHPMTQPIQALNILGAQTPTSTSSAPAAETSPAEGDTVHQVVVVGSGPAGYTAAIYAARAEMNPIVIAGALDAGGALMTTTDVENYPGFAEGIQGPELMTAMQEQAERFGGEVLFEDAGGQTIEGTDRAVRHAQAP